MDRWTDLILIRISTFCSCSTTLHTIICTFWMATPRDTHRSPM